MVDSVINKKSVALFIVLVTLFLVIVLARVLLSIFLSHGRLTHHQISRIQAYYASMAGVNYAYESLRTGVWSIPASGVSYSWRLCNGCTGANEINEPLLPNSVADVVIIVTGQAGTPSASISATSTYTYP
jgi:hypothetical protein